MSRLSFLCLCLGVLAGHALARAPKYGEPLPAEAWLFNEETENGIQDAAFLLDYTQYNSTHVKHYRLIRIISEEGKKAAAFSAESRWINKIRGRVIDRDGGITDFENGEDFVDITAFRNRDEEQKNKVLIPPGLSDDCVVEIEWTMNGRDGIEGDAFYQRKPIPEAYYCRKKVIDIRLLTADDFWVTRYVWRGVSAPTTLTKARWPGSQVTLIYEHLPPRKAHPFGNPFYDPSLPFFLIFRTVPNFGVKPETFWPRFSEQVLKSFHDDLNTGADHRAWVNALRSQLSADPATHPKKNPIHAARVALDRLQQRIGMPPLLTPTQMIAYRRHRDHEGVELADCFGNGWAESEHMVQLYLETLRRLDIPAKLVFTNSLQDAPIRREELNPYAFDWMHPLMRVEQGKDQAVFCAWRPDLEPGYLPAEQQGLAAMIVDPKRGWKPTFDWTPRFGPRANRMQTSYQATLSDEGRLSLAIEQVGTNHYNALTSHLYYHLPDHERDQALRKNWQQLLGKQYTLTESAIVGDRDLQETTVIRVKAHLSLDTETRFVSMHPFPISTVPITPPEWWTRDRREPIFMPRPFVQMSTLHLKLPAAWQLKGAPSWHKVNDLGSVKFVAFQKDDLLTVQRIIQLNAHIIHAQGQDMLRLFLAWVDEVEMQQIAIAKGGA